MEPVGAMTDDNKLRLRCPVCGKKLSATQEKLGKMARCPHCGDTVRVSSANFAPDDPLATIDADHERIHRAHPIHDEPVGTTVVEEAGGLVWKVLFFAVTPMCLALGAFLGYALRPPTPEDLLADAKADAEETLSEAEKEAGRILAEARQAASRITPAPETGGTTVGVDAGALTAAERAYINRVVLVRQETGMSDLGTPAVMGELRNTGNRALAVVELTLTYNTPRGRTAQSKKHYPVNANPEAMGYTPPLPAGATTSFVINTDDAPAGAAGEPEIRVTRVEFAG